MLSVISDVIVSPSGLVWAKPDLISSSHWLIGWQLPKSTAKPKKLHHPVISSPFRHLPDAMPTPLAQFLSAVKIPSLRDDTMWSKLFGRKKEPPQEVTKGRFELEQDGHTAYLEYTIAGKILALLHTEIPKELRGRGLASELTRSALQWARDNQMKVDVICPSVAGYLERHPEYSDLELK
jgi:uncharacterized protein